MHSKETDEIRLRLLHNTIFYRYLNDPSALALGPQTLSFPLRAYVMKNFAPVHEAGKFKMFDPKYRVYEIGAYKRDALATDAIDKHWNLALNQISQTILRESSANISFPQPNQQRNYQLETKAENYRKERKLAQLFKGLDGDKLGKARELPSELNWTTLPEFSNDQDSGRPQHPIYQHIENLIESQTNENQQVKTYADLMEVYDFQFPSHYGLEPFIGQ